MAKINTDLVPVDMPWVRRLFGETDEERKKQIKKLKITTRHRGAHQINIVRESGRVRYVHVTTIKKVITRCSRIVPNLFQGARPAQFPFYADAVINLESRLPKFNFQKLRAYLHVPIDDTPEAKPSLEWLAWVVSVLEGWIDGQGWSVLVHCQAGRSRSSLITIAYLMKTRNLKYVRAWELVSERRPVINPNSGFIQLLREYEKTLFPDI